MTSYVYLASPYTILDTDGLSEQAIKNRRTRRFNEVCKKAAQLMEGGELVFCPIAHSHPIEVHGMETVHDGDFWLKQDFALLQFAKKLVVFKMDGWEQSNGVRREIEFAKELNIPVEYID